MRYIYVLREPGDVVVSAYHFMNGALFDKNSIGIEDFARGVFIAGHMPWGTYWSHLLSWWPRLADRFREVSGDIRAELDAIWKREIEAAIGLPSYEHLRAHIASLHAG